MNWVNAILYACIIVAASRANAQTVLKLNDYMSQVEAKNQNIVSSKMAVKSAELRQNESELLFRPSLLAQYSSYSDQSYKVSPSIMGTKTVNDGYTVGVQEVTPYGLQGNVSYKAYHTAITGITPGALAMPDYYDVNPSIDASLSLWRNFLGEEVRSVVGLQVSQQKANKLGEQFRVVLSRVDAEATYWRLAMVRDTLEVNRQSLARAEKIRDWNAGRVKMRLADESDMLQAEAIVRLRKMEVEMSQNEERSASLAFNAARNIDGDSVPEKLENLASLDVEKVETPKRAENRLDVQQMKELVEVQKAASRAGVQKNTPSVDVFGNYTWNGRKTTLDAATDDYSQSGRPTTTIGVKAVIPLDFGLMSDAKEGYRSDENVAKVRLERKQFEQEKDWNDLEQKLNESKRKYLLAKSIEEAQHEKYKREKSRHDNGRSTTYYVLLFEQDYESAQLNRIRAGAEVLSLIAQMKSFGGVK